MLGNEQEAVSLVEATVAKVETDPCAQGPLAYAEARTLLAQTAVQRMAALYPEAFTVPVAQAAVSGCIDTQTSGETSTDELTDSGLAADPFGTLLSGAGRAGMREWLEKLTPVLRAIFVLRAVAGQNSEQTAENLRQSGALGAQGWRKDLVSTAYRQALCSLATCLVSSRSPLVPA
jgi:hypothetical protein